MHIWNFEETIEDSLSIELTIVCMEYDEWSEEDDNYNITVDVAGSDLDPRLVNLRQGPVDRSFTGGVHLQENKVEIEDEWFTLRRNLIQHYNVCYGLKQVEW